MTFKLISFHDYPESKTQVNVFKHIETGALHYHTQYDTNENTFLVSFTTLPENDNGVAHILEHCVLNGSQNYPYNGAYSYIKNKNFDTISNAATSYDSTQYHFTAIHEKGFFNLLSFYLDAVFFPLLKEQTLYQEGWHFSYDKSQSLNSLDSTLSSLSYNGIVLNEMIGGFINADKVIGVNMRKLCFAHSQYQHYSGGYPTSIPNVTISDIKEFHKKFYHPSNAVFHTFGSFPIEKFHTILDTNLSFFTKSQSFNIPSFSMIPSLQQAEHPGEHNYVYIKNYQLSDFETVEDYFKIFIFLTLLKNEKIFKDFNTSLEDNNIKGTMKEISLLPLNKPVISITFHMLENNYLQLDIFFNDFLYHYDFTLDKDIVSNFMEAFEIIGKEGQVSSNQFGLKKIKHYLILQKYGINNIEECNNIELLKQLFSLFENPNIMNDFVSQLLINNQNTSQYLSIPNKNYNMQLEKTLKTNLISHAKSYFSDFIENNDYQAIIDFIDNQKKEVISYQQAFVNMHNIPSIKIKDLTTPKKNYYYDNRKQWADSIGVNTPHYDLYSFTEHSNGVNYLKLYYHVEITTKKELFYFYLIDLLINKLPVGQLSINETIDWKDKNLSYLSSNFHSLISNITHNDTSDIPKKILKNYISIETKFLERYQDVALNKIEQFISVINFNCPDIIYQEITKSYQKYINNIANVEEDIATNYSKSYFSTINYQRYLSHEFYIEFLPAILENNDLSSLIKNLKKFYKKAFSSKPEVFYSGQENHLSDLKHWLAFQHAHLVKDKKFTSKKIKNNTFKAIDNKLSQTIEDSLLYMREGDCQNNIILHNSSASFVTYTIQTIPIEHVDSTKMFMFVNYIKSYLSQEIRMKNGAYTTQAQYSQDMVTFQSNFDPTPEKTVDIMNNVAHFILNNPIDSHLFYTNKLNLLKQLYTDHIPIVEQQGQFINILKNNYREESFFYNQVLDLIPSDIAYIAQKYFININPIITIITNKTLQQQHFTHWKLLNLLKDNIKLHRKKIKKLL